MRALSCRPGPAVGRSSRPTRSGPPLASGRVLAGGNLLVVLQHRPTARAGSSRSPATWATIYLRNPGCFRGSPTRPRALRAGVVPAGVSAAIVSAGGRAGPGRRSRSVAAAQQAHRLLDPPCVRSVADHSAWLRRHCDARSSPRSPRRLRSDLAASCRAERRNADCGLSLSARPPRRTWLIAAPLAASPGYRSPRRGCNRSDGVIWSPCGGDAKGRPGQLGLFRFGQAGPLPGRARSRETEGR